MPESTTLTSLCDEELVDFSCFGDDTSFHHVGVAVPSIASVSPNSTTKIDEAQGVRTAFVTMHGAPLELLEPLDGKSPIARSLREGTKLLHLCFEVANLGDAIQRGRAAGFHRIAHPVPSPVFANRRIAWVFSRVYGLIELLERDTTPGR